MTGQRGDGFKQSEGRFRLVVMKKFFPARAVAHWHRLFKETVAVPFLAAYKAGLDGSLSNLVS